MQSLGAEQGARAMQLAEVAQGHEGIHLNSTIIPVYDECTRCNDEVVGIVITDS